jgi:copper chaperone
MEKPMLSFQVDDMSCGHCVSAITQALKAADRDAVVHIDLAAHKVQVEPAAASAAQLQAAIEDAGYTPVAIAG